MAKRLVAILCAAVCTLLNDLTFKSHQTYNWFWSTPCCQAIRCIQQCSLHIIWKSQIESNDSAYGIIALTRTLKKFLKIVMFLSWFVYVAHILTPLPQDKFMPFLYLKLAHLKILFYYPTHILIWLTWSGLQLIYPCHTSFGQC